MIKSHYIQVLNRYYIEAFKLNLLTNLRGHQLIPYTLYHVRSVMRG